MSRLTTSLGEPFSLRFSTYLRCHTLFSFFRTTGCTWKLPQRDRIEVGTGCAQQALLPPLARTVVAEAPSPSHRRAQSAGRTDRITHSVEAWIWMKPTICDRQALASRSAARADASCRCDGHAEFVLNLLQRYAGRINVRKLLSGLVQDRPECVHSSAG